MKSFEEIISSNNKKLEIIKSLTVFYSFLMNICVTILIYYSLYCKDKIGTSKMNLFEKSLAINKVARERELKELLERGVDLNTYRQFE